MLHNPLQTFRHKYYYSMINRDDPQVIPDYYAQNIENWFIRDRGQLVMRPGITARGANPAKTNLGAAALYRANGVKKHIRVVDGSGNTAKFQQSDDGVTWTDIAGGGSRTSGKPWSFVQANNKLYGVNGYDTPISFDATTLATVAAIPNGTAIEWWKNFMWVTGVISIPDRLYFSTVNDPETWGGTDFINVNLGDASQAVGIKGTGGLTGRLYVGKQRSVWYITGTSSASFALDPLTFEHGIASHRSMIQVKNDVWAVDAEGNVRALYRTTNDVPFSNIKSSDIQLTVAGLNKAALYKTTAIFYNNYAMFFVPNGVDDYNSIVLVYDTLANEGHGGWITFTGWRIAIAIVFNDTSPKLFLHDARTSNGQTYEWTGTSDNGVSITAKYEGKIYDHGYPDQQKVWHFAYQYAPVIGDFNVRFYCSIDRYYYVLLKLVNLLGTGNKLLGVNWTLGVDKLGSGGIVQQRVNYSDMGGQSTGLTQQIKIEAESSSTQIKVREFTSHYRLRGLH
jgi:hypothetical protein